MSLITSPELFINVKRVPDFSSEEYDAFFQQELHKIRYGVTINGVFIHGWLYWHINHWEIYKDIKDVFNQKEIIRRFDHPDFRDNEWIITEHLIKAEEQQKGLLIFGSRRMGKDLLDSSILYTEDGTKTIGDAEVGDRIYGADGKLTTITGVFPQGIRPIYKVSLRDGRTLFCGRDHNWYVWDKSLRRHVVKTTGELLENYKAKRIHNGYKNGITRELEEMRYFIPQCSPVQYEQKKFVLDPYFLGVWLGDGDTRSARITSEDVETVLFLKLYAGEFGLLVNSKGIEHRISSGKRGGSKTLNRTKNPILSILREQNLIGNKHIPEEYFYGDVYQRLSLLQGLMDTDGWCSNGNIGFIIKEGQLADDFERLVRSLGIGLSRSQQTKYCTYKGEKKYCVVARFNLFTDLPVFRLGRKSSKLQVGNKKKQPRINKTAIVDIQYVFNDFSTCITVDNEDHLFLTDNYTVTHNTAFEASWLGRGATIFEGSENVLSGTNEADIKVLASALDKGLANLHPYMRFDRLQDDWRKEVSLGYKQKKIGGKRYEWSKIWIRNLDEGKNTEAIAGTTPKTLVIDEVGKHDWLLAFAAAVPGFTTDFGWRCVPICVGTGGTFTPNSDAQKVFENPGAYNFLAVEWPGRVKKIGLFMPGVMRMEGKRDSTFGEYLKTKEGILLPKDSELINLPFRVTDIEKARAVTAKEMEQYGQADDPKVLLKQRMYYPDEPEDCFLSDEINEFPIAAIREHLKWMDDEEGRGTPVGEAVELYRDVEGKVRFTTHTKLKEIRDFPVTSATIKDAPIIIYERPVDTPSPFLYIAGGDPYNQNTSTASPSLGTLCIYKRFYDPVNGTCQNQVVASWAARPYQMKEWHKIAEMFLELYGATLMIENAGTNFIEYMDGKHKSHLMADGYNLLREISPNTGIQNRPKGLPATPAVIRHCMNLLYDYCNEEIEGLDTQGKAIRKLGVTRIKDRMTLIEMLNYTTDGNFDRIVALRHALAYDQHLQKINPIVNFTEQPAPTPPPQRQIISPFTKGQSPFSGMRRKSPF